MRPLVRLRVAVCVLSSICGCERPQPAEVSLLPPNFGNVTYLGDGFAYPVGEGDCGARPLSAYRVEVDFLATGYSNSKLHTGEDWNRGAGDADNGDTVCAIGAGLVAYADTYDRNWGKVVLIRHVLPDNSVRWSQYAHLSEILVVRGEYVGRGQRIGTIGKPDPKKKCDSVTLLNCTHLHLEIRQAEVPPGALWNKKDLGLVMQRYLDPSNKEADVDVTLTGFIEANPPPPTWCAVVDFTGNSAGSLPPGWSVSGIAGDAGIRNDRLEAHPVDGSVRVASAGGSPRGLWQLAVDYTGSNPASYWGVHRELRFTMTDGSAYTFSDVNATFNYGDPNRLILQTVSTAPDGSQTIEREPVQLDPHGDHDHRYRLVIEDGRVDWTVTRLATGDDIARVTQFAPSLQLSNIVGVQWELSTTDADTWGDDLGLLCRVL